MLSRSRSVSMPVLQTRMTDQNQICPNRGASTVTDVLARLCKWQTPFSGWGDASKRIVNKFRGSAILQLNIEDLATSKMSVLYLYRLINSHKKTNHKKYTLRCIDTNYSTSKK